MSLNNPSSSDKFELKSSHLFKRHAITEIKNSTLLFKELCQAKDIPSQFLPSNENYCLVVTAYPALTGELSKEVIDQIHDFGRKHIEDPRHARWLLVHLCLENSPKPQSTLVCFIQHFSPNALVDNTEGVGVANQVLMTLQALDGLTTTNINYELIRKMSSKFGVLFGGSFADLANSLRVHSLDQSVRKTETVAHDKSLLAPVHVPNKKLGLSPGKGNGEPVLEDEDAAS